MFPTAYVDVSTTKFYFRELFLVAHFSRKFKKPSEKVPENVCFRARWATRSQLVTRGIGDFILGELPPRCLRKLAYCRPADIGNVNDQTRLPLGAALARAHQGLAHGVFGLASPTPPRVALWGPWGSNIAVNDRRVAVTLTWPWWSLEGSRNRAQFTTALSSCRVFVVTPQ
jgi:hypothetical protein